MGTVAFAPNIAGIAETADAWALSVPDLSYIEAARPVFEDMRQIVNQLASLLLLSQAVKGHGIVVADLLSRSRQLLAESRAAFDALRPGSRGSHHHLHMRKALERLGIAISAADEEANGLRLGDRGLRALTAAWQELIYASNALPGFERVDLSQSCCAQHLCSTKSVFSCQGAIE